MKKLLSGLFLLIALQWFFPSVMAFSTEPAEVVLLPQQSQEPFSQEYDRIRTHSAENKEPLSQAEGVEIPHATTVTETRGSSVNVPSLHGAPLVRAGNTYANAMKSTRQSELRFGRRMHTQNHMLGDFDGLMVDYGLGNFVINGIAGFPIGYGADGIDPSNQLFGLSAGVRKPPKGWDLSGYYVMELQGANQNDSSLLGGAIRYAQNNRSLLISADYDLLNRSLSRLVVSSAWKLLPSSTLSTTIDIRQSNLPTPQNGYLQQTIASTDGWKWGLPFERIKVLTTTAPNDVTAIGFSISHDLPGDIKLNSDVAILNVSNDDALENLNTTLPDFNEYYFNLTLSGRGLLLPGSNNTVTLSKHVSDTYRRSSSILDSSYALTRQWLLAPRLQVEYQDNLMDRSTEWVASPALNVEYRWRKQSMINFSATGEWRKQQDANDAAYESSYAVSLGYQTDF